MSQVTSISPAIAKALVLLATKLEAVAKTKTNPAFKSKYASLDQILESVKPTLAECGLAVFFRQLPQDATDVVCVQTVVFHESGEAISGEFIAKTQKNDAQGVGGAITYLKRYGLVAILALETDDDDDGNSASAQKVASSVGQTQAVRPPVQAASHQRPAAAPRQSSLGDI